jgi:large conductance mechanosensitive channel
MKKILNEYKEFINQGNVVMVAVGLVMALYFKAIVDAIINGVIMPIISAIFGKNSFEEIGFDIGDARISIGLVINAIIVFLAVAFILYLIIKAYNRYLAKPDDEAEAATELSVLTEIRDELRSRP